MKTVLKIDKEKNIKKNIFTFEIKLNIKIGPKYNVYQFRLQLSKGDNLRLAFDFISSKITKYRP